MAESPVTDIFSGVRPNCQPGEQIRFGVRRVEDDTTIQPDDPARRSEEWVDLNLLDPGLLSDELTKTNQDLFERDHIDGLSAADALESAVDRSAFNDSTSEGLVERRQAQSTVLH